MQVPSLLVHCSTLSSETLSSMQSLLLAAMQAGLALSERGHVAEAEASQLRTLVMEAVEAMAQGRDLRPIQSHDLEVRTLLAIRELI